jgi:hypothetical protein
VQGNKKPTSFTVFSNSRIASNLSSIGVYLGRHLDDISVLANVLRHLEHNRLTIIPKVSTSLRLLS